MASAEPWKSSFLFFLSLLASCSSYRIENNSLALPSRGTPCPCVGKEQLKLLRKERELLEHERLLGLALLKRLELLRRALSEKSIPHSYGASGYSQRKHLLYPMSTSSENTEGLTGTSNLIPATPGTQKETVYRNGPLGEEYKYKAILTTPEDEKHKNHVLTSLYLSPPIQENRSPKFQEHYQYGIIAASPGSEEIKYEKASQAPESFSGSGQDVNNFVDILPPDYTKVKRKRSTGKKFKKTTTPISDYERNRRSIRRKKRRKVLNELSKLEGLEDHTQEYESSSGIPQHDIPPPGFRLSNPNQAAVREEEYILIDKLEGELPVELPPEKIKRVLGPSSTDADLMKMYKEMGYVKGNRQKIQTERYALEQLRQRSNNQQPYLISDEEARKKLEREKLERERLLLQENIQEAEEEYDLSRRLSNDVESVLHEPRNKQDEDLERRRQHVFKLEAEAELELERIRLREEEKRGHRGAARLNSNRPKDDENTRLERERVRLAEEEARLYRIKRRLKNQKEEEKELRKKLKVKIANQLGITTETKDVGQTRLIWNENLEEKQAEERRILSDVVKLKMAPLPNVGGAEETGSTKEDLQERRVVALKEDAIELEKVRIKEEDIKRKITRQTSAEAIPSTAGNAKSSTSANKVSTVSTTPVSTITQQQRIQELKELEKLANDRREAERKKQAQTAADRRIIDQRLIENANAVVNTEAILANKQKLQNSIVADTAQAGTTNGNGKTKRISGQVEQLTGSSNLVAEGSAASSTTPQTNTQSPQNTLPASYFNVDQFPQNTFQTQEEARKALEAALLEAVASQNNKQRTSVPVQQYEGTGNLLGQGPVSSTGNGNSKTLGNANAAVQAAEATTQKMIESMQNTHAGFEASTARMMSKKESVEEKQKLLNDELQHLLSIPESNITTRLRKTVVITQINITTAELVSLQYEIQLLQQEHSWVEKEIQELEEADDLDKKKFELEVNISRDVANSTEKEILLAELAEVDAKLNWLSQRGNKSETAKSEELQFQTLKKIRTRKERNLSQLDQRLLYIVGNRAEAQYTPEDKQAFINRTRIAKKIADLRAQELSLLRARLSILNGLVNAVYTSPYTPNARSTFEEKSYQASAQAASKEAKLEAEGPSISGLNACDAACLEEKRLREERRRLYEKEKEEARLRRLAKHEAFMANQRKLAEEFRLERLRKHQLLMEERKKLHMMNKDRRKQGLPIIPYTPVMTKRNVTWTGAGIGAEIALIDQLIQKEEDFLGAGMKRNDEPYCNERRKRIQILLDRKKMLNLRLAELKARIERLQARENEVRQAYAQIEAARAMWLTTHNLTDPYNVTGEPFMAVSNNASDQTYGISIKGAEQGVLILDNEMNTTNNSLIQVQLRNQTHLISYLQQRLLVLQDRRRYLTNLVDQIAANQELKNSFYSNVSMATYPPTLDGAKQDLHTLDSNISTANQKLLTARNNNQTHLTKVLEERIRMLQKRKLELQSRIGKLQAEKAKKDAEAHQRILDEIRKRQEERKRRVELLRKKQASILKKKQELQKISTTPVTKNVTTYHVTTYVDGKAVSTTSHQVLPNSTHQA